VLPSAPWACTACGNCFFCRRGDYHKCDHGRVFGHGATLGSLQGAQAESVLVPNANLTLRRVPEGGVVTHKGPRLFEAGLKSREERETAVADPDVLQDILERLGLRPVFRYQKYREAYEWRGQEIVVDETPIGTFLEIEGDPEGIRAAASALGFGPGDYVTDSYVGLFLAAGGQGDMVFP